MSFCRVEPSKFLTWTSFFFFWQVSMSRGKTGISLFSMWPSTSFLKMVPQGCHRASLDYFPSSFSLSCYVGEGREGCWAKGECGLQDSYSKKFTASKCCRSLVLYQHWEGVVAWPHSKRMRIWGLSASDFGYTHAYISCGVWSFQSLGLPEIPGCNWLLLLQL